MVRMLSVKEAAKELSIHEQTLRAWERKGFIKAHRLPGSRYRRFAAEEVGRVKRAMAGERDESKWELFTRDSSLFGLVGIGRSARGDVSERVDEELARIYGQESG